MRTKTIKALLLTVCAVLLVVSTVFVTMAYLTDNESIQNTFTFGQVGITLDEADVDKNGVIEAGADRTSTQGRIKGNEYHLMPGHSYTKDPTIHVDETSEDCWLFVKLENGLKDIIADTSIEKQMEANGWTIIDSDNNIWAYKEIVSAKDNIDVFDSFKIKNDADVSKYATVKNDQGQVTGGTTIDITAYAVQANGFNSTDKTALENATSAWETASGSFSAN